MDYKDFFSFKESPFHITPDPAYFFPSSGHQGALETLLYGIRSGEGFVQITGDPGMGKTLLIRTILREVGGQVNTALIFNPRLSPHELLWTLLEDLGLDPGTTENLSREAMLRKFRDYLLEMAATGCRVIVIIDEAQNLPVDTLEELRLLTNLETEKEKLLQIILAGQRELETRLDLPELWQLHQRITIRYRLQELSRQDMQAYISHRLKIAGREGTDVSVRFTPKAMEGIYRFSRGIPRLVNVLCERSLMAAYVEGVTSIRIDHVQSAVESIRGNEVPEKRSGPGRLLLMAALVILVAAIGIALAYRNDWPGMIFDPKARPVAHDVIREPEVHEPAREQGQPEPSVEDSVSAMYEPVLELERVEAPESVPNPALPPVEAFRVSPDAWYAHVILDENQVRIWRGSGETAVLEGAFTHTWPHGPGLFMAGEDTRIGMYLFNHSRFMQGSYSGGVPSAFFQEVRDLVPVKVLPVLVGNRDTKIDSTAVERAAEVVPVFRRFISHWSGLRLADLFSLYGEKVRTHSLGVDYPVILSKEELYSRKKQVFQRSGFIRIRVVDDAFFIDPADPEKVMAVYHQTYRSKIWEDSGTKVIYFGLQKTRKQQGQEAAWKNIGEWWVTD